MTKTILIVDDSNCVREMVHTTLRSAGFEVVEAQNGLEALGRLEGKAIDLILTDIHMPVMDGLTFTRRVRVIAAYRGTPILVLTTEAGQEMKERGREAGATGWIVKPFHPETLLQVVDLVLKKRPGANKT